MKTSDKVLKALIERDVENFLYFCALYNTQPEWVMEELGFSKSEIDDILEGCL